MTVRMADEGALMATAVQEKRVTTTMMRWIKSNNKRILSTSSVVVRCCKDEVKVKDHT